MAEHPTSDERYAAQAAGRPIEPQCADPAMVSTGRPGCSACTHLDGKVFCENRPSAACWRTRQDGTMEPAHPAPAETQQDDERWVLMLSSGTDPWYFNEGNGALYGPADAFSRRVVATMLDAVDGHALAAAMNAAALADRPSADTEKLRARIEAIPAVGTLHGVPVVALADLRAALDAR